MRIIVSGGLIEVPLYRETTVSRLQHRMSVCMPLCGLAAQASWPNSCNLNLYQEWLPLWEDRRVDIGILWDYGKSVSKTEKAFFAGLQISLEENRR